MTQQVSGRARVPSQVRGAPNPKSSTTLSHTKGTKTERAMGVKVPPDSHKREELLSPRRIVFPIEPLNPVFTLSSLASTWLVLCCSSGLTLETPTYQNSRGLMDPAALTTVDIFKESVEVYA